MSNAVSQRNLFFRGAHKTTGALLIQGACLRPRILFQVKPIRIHDFCPGSDKVLHKLLLSIILCI